MKFTNLDFIVAFCFGNTFSGVGYVLHGWLGWWWGLTLAVALSIISMRLGR